MADQASALAKVDTFRAEVAAIGGGPPPPPAPTITNATATPATLPIGGGNVVVDATVTDAMWTSVDGVQQSLPATVAVVASRAIPVLAHGQTAPDANASLPVTVAQPSGGDLSWFTSKAPGSITNIGTATLAAVDVSNGRILAASGQLYVPWIGNAGSIDVRGGGHGDWNGNEKLRLDLFLAATGGANPATIVKPRYTNLVIGPNGYNAEVASGLLWANAAGSATVPNEYSSGHTYGQCVLLPPGFGTNDPLGAALYTGIPSLTPGGQQNGMSCFLHELSTNHYAPFVGPMSVPPEYSSSFIDVGRRRVVYHGSGKLIGIKRSPTLPTCRPRWCTWCGGTISRTTCMLVCVRLRPLAIRRSCAWLTRTRARSRRRDSALHGLTLLVFPIQAADMGLICLPASCTTTAKVRQVSV